MTDPRWNDESPEWFVLRSQTKREHIAAKILGDIEGVEVFCPRIRYKKATRRGKIWWVEPLFPSYLLAKFHYPTLSRQVTASHGIINIVNFGGQTISLKEEVVTQIRALVQDHSTEEDIIEFKPSISVGDEVEVADGAFKGVTGTITEPLSAQERVKVLIDLLGQPQIIEVDLYSLLLPQRPQPEP